MLCSNIWWAVMMIIVMFLITNIFIFLDVPSVLPVLKHELNVCGRNNLKTCVSVHSVTRLSLESQRLPKCVQQSYIQPSSVQKLTSVLDLHPHSLSLAGESFLTLNNLMKSHIVMLHKREVEFQTKWNIVYCAKYHIFSSPTSLPTDFLCKVSSYTGNYLIQVAKHHWQSK